MSTRAERHQETRAKHAAEARISPSKYELNRRTRRTLSREIARTTEVSGAGILIPTARRGPNRQPPKVQRRARAKAY
mgnify:CR=1 FL=1